jgi:hypothetical protein
VLLPQTLVTDQHEEMADSKEDGTPMPLAHYHVGDGSHIILRINVSALSPCCQKQWSGVWKQWPVLA